jgi:hypothetical protein
MTAQKFFFAMLAVAVFLTACSQPPPPAFMNAPPPNPKAPMAWLNEGGGMNSKMQLQYAEAMQNAGLFNFVVEDFSEEQLEKAVQIRMDYTEEKGKYNRIPILRLKTEVLEEGTLKFKFSLIEESDEVVYNNRNRNREKTYRQSVLLQRFLEELKRATGKDKDASCKG